MSELLDGLNRILNWITLHQPNYLEYLQPGLSKAEIDLLVEDLPFQLPPELYELYQWRNGSIQREEDEAAWIFHDWSFKPLEAVVNEHKNKLIFTHEDLFINIFFHLEWPKFGGINIINNIQNNTVIFMDFYEGSLDILDRYYNLNTMVNTIAESYEQDPNHQNFYMSYRNYEIWYKYNAQPLLEVALEVLEKRPFSPIAWIKIVNILVEFKDLRSVRPLIKWLELLLEYLANLKEHTVLYEEQWYDANNSFDSQLSKKAPDNYEYCNMVTGIPKLLGEIGDSRAVPILIVALQNEKLYNFNWCSRICAAKALGQLKDQRATTPLIETLNDPSDWVRKTVAWALGEIGDIQSAPALITALQDDYKEVRNAARDALIKLISLHPSVENLLDF